MPKKNKYENNAEVIGSTCGANILKAPTTSEKTSQRFSRANRICVCVDAKGKVLKESNYLDCLYYCAINTDKALRVEFLQAKIPSFYDRLRDSEALAKQLLAGNAIYINASAKTLSESIVAENNTIDRIAVPDDIMQGPVDLNSIEYIADVIEKSNLNCILVIIKGDNPEDEINAKLDQVCDTIPSNQIRPLYSGEQPPSFPMLEDFGFPEEASGEKDDEGKTEFTNNHQGEAATTRDSTEQGQVIALTTDEQGEADEPEKPAEPEVTKNADEQYSEPKETPSTPDTDDKDSSDINTYSGPDIPVAISGMNSGFLGRGL
jgi:hypothetical protein